jgi:RNA polymerase sigma-70 factor (sigma-E family)
MRDDREFEAFVAASQPALRRTAYLLCGDWQLASDYVQEGLIRVYRRWHRLERDGRLHSYARKAVVSAALDARRRRSSSEVVTDPSDAAAGSAPDHAVPTSERMVLLGALAALPPRQRACVVLRYYEDLPVAEVAALLSISDGTVKSQTSRGLAALQYAFTAARDDDLVVG